MKRSILLFMMLVLLGGSFPPAAEAANSGAITLLFTGAVKGMLDPCDA